MDYISQMEKIFKFLELNLDYRGMQHVLYIKRRFNNDLNLFGCFIKDFLILNTLKVPGDEDLYSEFVVFFSKNGVEKNLLLLDKYSQCYLSIVFEDCDNEDILEAITTANACFMMEAYPALMKILYIYYHQKNSGNHLRLMLQSTKDFVIEKFGLDVNCKTVQDNISPLDFLKSLDSIEIQADIKKDERLIS